MVVSTQLGLAVAQLLAIPETSAATHVRNLREAGLLSKTGRGITAAHMTPHDGAHLLIAAAASVNVKDSVETVQKFSKLLSGNGPVTCGPSRFIELGSNHSFVHALAALLGAVADREFKSGSEFEFEVRLMGPRTRAEIECKNPRAGTASTIHYQTPNEANWRKPKKLIAASDITRQSSFTEITLLQIGALIGGLI